MRDIFVTLFFFGSMTLAFKRPYVAALLWVWVGLMNPHRMGWGFAYYFPFAMIAAIGLVLSIALNLGKARWPTGAPAFVLLLLVAWMGVTTFGAIAFSESLAKYIDTLKVLLMTFVVAAVVRTREEIIGLVLVTAGSIALFGIKGGIFTILTGGNHLVWGPPSSVIEGNNELAVALIIVVPLLYFMSTQVALIRQLPYLTWLPEKLTRSGLYVAILLCLISALGSHSRGALLAMAIMAALLWWRSKSKGMLGAVIVIMLMIGLAFMPDGWTERMSTIGTYEEDTSAMGRINAWTMATNIANDRLLGAGFVTDLPAIYQTYAPNPNFVIVAHSIYFEILGEHGYIGLFIYLLFWLMTYRLAGRITQLSAGRDDLQWAYTLGSMSKICIMSFAVGGAFLSLAYWDMPYYIMVILLCTKRLVADTLAMPQSELSVVDASDSTAPANPSDQREWAHTTGHVTERN